MKTIKVPKGKSFRSKLVRLGACGPAIEWVGKKSFHTAWNTCPDSAWMVWLVYALGDYSRAAEKLAERATVACVKHFIPELPKRHRKGAKTLLSGGWYRHDDMDILLAAYVAGFGCTWGAVEILPPCANFLRAKVPEAKVAAWLEKV